MASETVRGGPSEMGVFFIDFKNRDDVKTQHTAVGIFATPITTLAMGFLAFAVLAHSAPLSLAAVLSISSGAGLFIGLITILVIKCNYNKKMQKISIGKLRLLLENSDQYTQSKSFLAWDLDQNLKEAHTFYHIIQCIDYRYFMKSDREEVAKEKRNQLFRHFAQAAVYQRMSAAFKNPEIISRLSNQFI